jgi:hypothetical protein
VGELGAGENGLLVDLMALRVGIWTGQGIVRGQTSCSEGQ